MFLNDNESFNEFNLIILNKFFINYNKAFKAIFQSKIPSFQINKIISVHILRFYILEIPQYISFNNKN